MKTKPTPSFAKGIIVLAALVVVAILTNN